MNTIRFGEMIINLDEVARITYGEFEGRPSIDFAHSTTINDRNDGTRMARTQIWFDCEKTRDVVFSLLSDKVGAASIGDRASKAITRPPSS